MAGGASATVQYLLLLLQLVAEEEEEEMELLLPIKGPLPNLTTLGYSFCVRKTSHVSRSACPYE